MPFRAWRHGGKGELKHAGQPFGLDGWRNKGQWSCNLALSLQIFLQHLLVQTSVPEL